MIIEHEEHEFLNYENHPRCGIVATCAESYKESAKRQGMREMEHVLFHIKALQEEKYDKQT
ncbi:hypothetical protein DQX05_26185 [Paenibacillus thiaminolyticus]|uniref:Uncharacterized protein n=1 Tax=Paenibacillus thiaminolyticus TaxID=49283 RepID=A0A3A3GEV6_PANTH|nr:hypothetical protein DQX05_26185 [Paenibacillus thiaminolyticus]